LYSDLSVVNTVAGDVWFGDESVLSVFADDKDVLLSSGFELVSAVADNGVLGAAFSLVVDAVTTGEIIRFGLVRRSPKSESSLPIRGSISEVVASLE
jgi:hypothetical protein